MLRTSGNRRAALPESRAVVDVPPCSPKSYVVDMTQRPLLLFPDTNIFLHFRCFDEIDWRAEGAAGARECVLVILNQPVIGPLDRYKNEHRIAKLRDRASTALRKIEEIVGSGKLLPQGVQLEIYNEPCSNVPGLDTSDNDDRIIASALHCKQARNVDVAIVTADTGMRLRAPGFGVDVIRLHERYSHPPLPDELQEENKKLRAQLAAMPVARLRISFDDDSAERAWDIPKDTEPSDEKIAAMVRVQHQNAQPPEYDPILFTEERAIANRRNLRDYRRRMRVTTAVALRLTNDGESPVDDIHVILDLPPAVSVDVEPEREPVARLFEMPRIAALEVFTPGSWQLEDGRATCHVTRVKQKMHYDLPPLYLRLQDAVPQQLELALCVNAGSPPLDEETTLLIRVTVAE